MAKRFHSVNIRTNKNNVDVIEIYDTSFSGASTEFKTRSDGYRLRYDNASKQRFEPVLPATLSFDMQIQNATHEALITDLTSSEEGRFQVKLIRNGSLRWAGPVVIDMGEREDISYPYDFTIEAVDLGLLANKDYADTGGVAFSGWETLIQHIIRALDLTGIPAFAYAAAAPMLTTVCNWYEDSMTTGAAQDPFALTRCNHRAFYDIESSGKYRFLSALDVLRQIMQRMGCVLRQSGGQFRIFQVTQYNNASVRVRKYDADGVYLSNALETYTTTIDQTNAGARLAGGRYTWMAPIKQLREVFKHRNWTNLIAGAEFDNTGTPFLGPSIENALNVSLTMSLKVTRTLFNNNTPVGTSYLEIYRIIIQVGTHYLERSSPLVQNGVVQYGPTIWTDQPSSYFFHFNNNGSYPSPGNSGTMSNQFDLTTPVLQSTGDFSIHILSAGFPNATTGAQETIETSSLSITGTLVIDDFQLGTFPTDTAYEVTNTSPSANAISVDLVSYIGDATTDNTLSRLQVFGGTVWTDSSQWQVAGAGTKYKIQDLLLRELLAGQKTTIPISRHVVGYTSYEPHERLDDGDDIWAFLGGVYIAAMDDWQGEWYRVTYSNTTISSITPYEIPSGGGIGPPKGGGVGNPISPSNPPYTPPPNLPQIPQTPAPQFPPVDGLILGGLSGGQTSSTIPVGPVSVINIRQTLVNNAYVIGQQITVIDPFYGVQQNFIVTQNTVAGDTSVTVSGYAVNTLSPGSFVFPTGANGVIDGIGSGSPSTDSETTSAWWAVFQQWWTTNSTNDPNWPIQSTDVGFETDENAGNGSTAGLRFDGDGLQSFTASSATPGVKIGLAGLLELNNLATGTGTDGLIVEGGVVKKKTLSAGVTDHGALTGLGDDDHTQYTLLAGRSGGQTVNGGTAASNNLTLNSTSNASKGKIILNDTVQVGTAALGSSNYMLTWNNSTLAMEYQLAVNASAGAGDAGKLVKLDAGGKIAGSMLDQTDVDHGSIGGLSDDDHSQYALLAGRSTGQTLKGGANSGASLTLQSTSNAGRGNVIIEDTLQLNTCVTGTSTSVLILDSGIVQKKTMDNKVYVTLLAVPPTQTVTQTIAFDFINATWLVPSGLNGASITRIDYALTFNNSTTGSLTVGFDYYNTTNSVSSSNILSATFNTSDVRKSNTSSQTLTAGYFLIASVSGAAGGTLNGTVTGLLITIEITKA